MVTVSDLERNDRGGALLPALSTAPSNEAGERVFRSWRRCLHSLLSAMKLYVPLVPAQSVANVRRRRSPSPSDSRAAANQLNVGDVASPFFPLTPLTTLPVHAPRREGRHSAPPALLPSLECVESCGHRTKPFKACRIFESETFCKRFCQFGILPTNPQVIAAEGCGLKT